MRSPTLRRVPLFAAALAICPTPGVDSALNTGSVLVMRRSRHRGFVSLKRAALARSIRCGKSTAHSCGGRYGHFVSAHRSHRKHWSTTLPKSALSTPSTSKVSDSSIRSNSVGKAAQRLTHRRQPWQMSKTRSSSVSTALGSWKSGPCQSIGCRLGASRLPSVMPFMANPPSGWAKQRASLGGPSFFESQASRPRHSIASRAFWKRLACERSALAKVSNQSAISSKPSSRAVFAMPGYMSVYS